MMKSLLYGLFMVVIVFSVVPATTVAVQDSLFLKLPAQKVLH